MIRIEKLSSKLESEYEQLLRVSPVAMFNHSLRYREFLRQVLPDAESHYLLAYDDDELVAAIPAFLMNGPYGVVVNSLPFYGSHGGIVAKPNVEQDVFEELLAAFDGMCRDKNAVSSTLIDSPFGANNNTYVNYRADFLDQRIGQITTLPKNCDGVDLEDSLMDIFHYKTRNMVRKGARAGFDISHDGGCASFKALFNMHDENIRKIGGLPKPWAVFTAIQRVFKYNDDYRIYLAKRNGLIVSALLVFYFKGMVEYFTPATLEEFRNEQPMSLLIYSAMRDAVAERSALYWNWGGTWLAQDGVYQFKSRWGTDDLHYLYHIKLYRGQHLIASMSREKLLAGYPNFYVLPFTELVSV